MVQRIHAQWMGWIGTALFLALWLSIRWMGSPSAFPLWIALMLGSAVLCVVGAIFRSKGFFVPAVSAA